MARKKKNRRGRTDIGGQLLEQTIKCLQMVGFVEVKKKDYPALFERQYVCNMPYTTVWGSPGRMEYWLHSPEFTGRLECKFQSGSGSTDEKIALSILTLDKHEGIPALMLVFGGPWWSETNLNTRGYSRGSMIRNWAKNEAAKQRKPCYAIDIEEFFALSNKLWGR